MCKFGVMRAGMACCLYCWEHHLFNGSSPPQSSSAKWPKEPYYTAPYNLHEMFYHIFLSQTLFAQNDCSQ